MNTKPHVVKDANGRPLSFFMTAGQVSDYIGEAALLDDLLKAHRLLGARRYVTNWLRHALETKGSKSCIPRRKSRIAPIKYDKRRHRCRSRIEIMLGNMKNWHQVVTRYDRCPIVFLSTVALAATVILWLQPTIPDLSTDVCAYRGSYNWQSSKSYLFRRL